MDYISVGPIWETPTKEGRPATGLELIRVAAEIAPVPWFAIGGINPENVEEVIAAGAERICVVRAIRDADDPRAAASALFAAVDPAGASSARGRRMTGSRERKRAERQKRKRRSSERTVAAPSEGVPVETNGGAAESEESFPSGWPAAPRSETPPPGPSSSRLIGASVPRP